mgnify:CR=1 FL=1
MLKGMFEGGWVVGMERHAIDYNYKHLLLVVSRYYPQTLLNCYYKPSIYHII